MQLVYRKPEGPIASLELTERERAIIGRASTCDIVLDDRRVSRVHASITNVGGTHLLQDAGSANGTFLNGLRVNGASGFLLREGDLIEIGGTRIVCGDRGELPQLDTAPEERIVEQGWPLADLIRDGRARLTEGASGPDDDQACLIRTFARGQPGRALDEALELIVKRVPADTIALFLRHSSRGLHLIVAKPSDDAAKSLRDLALDALRRSEGRLHRGFGALSGRGGETLAQRVRSSTATPCVHANQTFAVLAVERHEGKPLDRAEVAALAALGGYVATAIALSGAPEEDTRFLI